MAEFSFVGNLGIGGQPTQKTRPGRAGGDFWVSQYSRRSHTKNQNHSSRGRVNGPPITDSSEVDYWSFNFGQMGILEYVMGILEKMGILGKYGNFGKKWEFWKKF